jgi:hypothetical protein
MVYFLNECKAVQRHPLWSRILPTYFEELKGAWAAQQALLEESDKFDDQEARDAAQLAARNAALDVAFEDVDLEELEAEWIEFVLSLEL